MEADKKNQEIIDSYDYLTNAASTTDCTGLIPANPRSEGVRDAYEAIYRYTPPEIKVTNPEAEHSPK